MSNYQAPDGVQIRIYSYTDQQIAILFPSSENAPITQVELEYNKIGGLQSFNFTLDKKTELPLYNGLRVDFYFNSVLWFTGYTEIQLSPEQNEPILNITGKGYVGRLIDFIVNETYTSKTIAEIIADLTTTYFDDTDLKYNASKITVPSLTLTEQQFKDKSLFDCFMELLKICNYDYEDYEYIWGIDEERELYFTLLDTDLVTQYFEGYHFQQPKIESDNSKLINKVVVFRTQQASPKEVEYVNTYTDSGSITTNGEKGKKITFPDYADNTTIGNVAQGIIQKYKDPIKKATIENLIVQEKLADGFYGVNSKIEEYYGITFDGNSVDEWDDSNAPNTTIIGSQEVVYTGRQSMKCTTTVNSYGDYIELVLDDAFWFPQIIRIFLYFKDTLGDLKFEIEDTDGRIIYFEYGTRTLNLNADNAGSINNLTAENPALNFNNLTARLLDTDEMVNQWINRRLEPPYINEDILTENNGSGEESLTENNGSGEEQLTEQGESYILNVKKIRIYFYIDQAIDIYIDRIDVLFPHWFYNRLSLEQAKYKISHDAVLIDAQFGDRVDNLLEEIQAKIEPGDVALNVFSKQ